MISPQMGRAVFRIAFFMTLVSIVMMFCLKPGSAEFVVAGVTLAVGSVFIVLIAVAVRRQSR